MKEVVKQVYRVKKDDCKCATSDLISNDKEPIKELTLATKGNEMKQSIVNSQSAKSEQKRLRVQKVKKGLSLLEKKS
jgi:hypothetical protein